MSSRTEFEYRSPTRRLTARRVALAALGLSLLLGGCDLLFDTDPPYCRLLAPADSSYVAGVVQVQASAVDSGLMTCVDFYADGVRFASDSSAAWSAQWDATGLPAHSWHWLHCVAYDFAGNAGYSDTAHVQVVAAGGRDVFHGRFDLAAGYYYPVGFAAEAGDTLTGDFRIQGGGTLSQFFWFDKANYEQFRVGGSYTPLLRADNRSEYSMSQPVAGNDSFYLVFLNTGSSQVTCWARFSLE